jgi:hypothetical protein
MKVDSPLYEAVLRGDIKKVAHLLKNADVNTRNRESGFTALHIVYPALRNKRRCI